MFYTSQSKVNNWRQCRRLFHFRYRQHLKPKVKARPLQFGSIIHTMMEASAEGKDEFVVLKEIAVANRKLFEREREQYGRIVEDITYIMRAYKTYWKNKPLTLIPFKDKKAEHSFEVEVTRNITMKGKIDGLVKAQGFRWLLEHKSHKNFPNDNHRWRNIQSAVYLRIIDMLGLSNFQGTLWNYVRSKEPTRPQLLQSGKLSERSLDSLPETVIDTIKSRGLEPAHYRDLIKNQEDNLHTWFQRVYTPVKPAVVKTVFAEFIETSREMSDYYDKHPHTAPPRTIARHCDWCAFEPLCRAELQGNDVDFLLSHEYIVDESDYQTTGDSDGVER